jgi:quinol monooxygenase YgiN
MHCITAVIRCQPDKVPVMRQALLDVVEHVKANEPETVSYFVAQDNDDPCCFTTYERFTDQAAMDRHNNCEAVAKFYAIARPILDGDVILVKSTELSIKL